MLLDIELSWQGMERERRLVDRISHFLVKSGQVVFAKTHCELWLHWQCNQVKRVMLLSKIWVGFMLLSKKAEKIAKNGWSPFVFQLFGIGLSNKTGTMQISMKKQTW